jgi:hypothetical protein
MDNDLLQAAQGFVDGLGVGKSVEQVGRDAHYSDDEALAKMGHPGRYRPESGEEAEHWGVEGDCLGGAADAAGGGVAAEDGDGGGVLIFAEEPAFRGVEGEVARGFAAA